MGKVSKKDKALELMKRLDVYRPYVDGFKENGYVCYFERFAGFWDYQDKELEAKRKEIEEKYKCLVYAITHEYICQNLSEFYFYTANTKLNTPFTTIHITQVSEEMVTIFRFLPKTWIRCEKSF